MTLCKSPAHTPSGWSSHDQNCCGVFFCLFVCFLMQRNFIEHSTYQRGRPWRRHTHLQQLMNECRGRPMAALALGHPGSNRNTEHGGRIQLRRLLVGGEGRRAKPAALISLVLDVLLLLSCNCSQSDSLILFLCRLWRRWRWDAGLTPRFN